MKAYSIAATIIILLLLFYCWETRTTFSESLEAEKKAKEFHIDRADKLHESNLRKDDSLNTAVELLRYANERTDRANEQTRKAIAYANSIKIVSFKTDAQRDSVLAVLYPH